MRINILANAPWGPTAYSGMARLFGPRFQRLGHEVSMTALWGLEGGIIDWCGIPVYAKGLERLTRDIQAAHAKHFRADVFMSWCDAFAVDAKRMQFVGIPWSPWFPVDSSPPSPDLVELIRQAQWPLVYSRFGLAEMHEIGLENVRYLPIGIDTDMFRPRDKKSAREYFDLPRDRYIVGIVQSNSNGNRKALEQQLLGFAQFQREHPDALLYVHTYVGAQMQGIDFLKVLRACGLEIGRDVRVASQHAYLANLYGDEAMANLYSAFDVLLSVTRGEGFGVPIVEAAACGTPAVVGDWSSMSELNFAGYAHPEEAATQVWNHFNSWWRLPRPDIIADLLDEAYRNGANGDALRTLALDYDADQVMTEYWIPLLAEMESGAEPASVTQNGKVYA